MTKMTTPQRRPPTRAKRAVAPVAKETTIHSTAPITAEIRLLPRLVRIRRQLSRPGRLNRLCRRAPATLASTRDAGHTLRMAAVSRDQRGAHAPPVRATHDPGRSAPDVDPGDAGNAGPAGSTGRGDEP